MNATKKRINEIKQMFYISIKNDLDKWTGSGYSYMSPSYNNIQFLIHDFTEYEYEGSISIGKLYVLNDNVLLNLMQFGIQIIQE
jgi:hypothetical protein